MPNPDTEWAGAPARKALATIRELGARTNAPCALCLQPIDYTLRYPNRDSCTVDHKKPQATHPHLRWDPSNWQPAHLRCNTPNAHAYEPTLGPTSWS